MPHVKSQKTAMLLDVLIEGFEKNEILGGYHWRNLPMPDEAAATQKYADLVEEARRWKGEPARTEEGARRMTAWPDLEIRQAGRGIMIRVRAPWFNDWWNQKATWADDPLGRIYEWLEEERALNDRSE